MKNWWIVIGLALVVPGNAVFAQTSSIQYLKPATSKIQVIGNYKAPKPVPDVVEAPVPGPVEADGNSQSMVTNKTDLTLADTVNMSVSLPAVLTSPVVEPMLIEAMAPTQIKAAAPTLTMSELRADEVSLPITQISSRTILER